MAEPCSFGSVKNENVYCLICVLLIMLNVNDNVKCLICNRELRKKEKVQKLSSKAWENFVTISKSWTNVNRWWVQELICSLWAIVHLSEVVHLSKKYWKTEKVKTIGKANYGTLISTKGNTFTERYDESNGWIRFQPWALHRSSNFITMVVTMVVSMFCK